MTPYEKVQSPCITPDHFDTDDEDSRKSFYQRFGRDERSFDFLCRLLNYCRTENHNQWPESITPQIEKSICPEGIERLGVYKVGYINRSEFGYEFMHEFIVLSYLCCAKTLAPLMAAHIDTQTITPILMSWRKHYGLEETDTTVFLIAVLKYLCATPGLLTRRVINDQQLMEIGLSLKVHVMSCVEDAHRLKLIRFKKETLTITCNTLLYLAYLASPTLISDEEE